MASSHSPSDEDLGLVRSLADRLGVLVSASLWDSSLLADPLPLIGFIFSISEGFSVFSGKQRW